MNAVGTKVSRIFVNRLFTKKKTLTLSEEGGVLMGIFKLIGLTSERSVQHNMNLTEIRRAN